MRFLRSAHAVSFLLPGMAIVALALVSGCSFLIPENPSAPRYNTVSGEARRPALNPQGGGAPAPRRAAEPIAPVPPPVAAEFPPVSPQTQAVADQQMGRQVPSENSYPVLSEVPPAPPPSTQPYMQGVQSQLEADRAAANAASAQLARDAAAEGSMLSELPATTAPSPEPVRSAPLPPPAPVYHAPAPVEPIVLRPPVAAPVEPAPAPFTPPSPSYSAPAPAYSAMPPAAAGGFNPMAGGAPSSSGASGFLPASRYRR